MVRVDGGVQQGAGVCGSVLSNVGNLAIKNETVFQKSFPLPVLENGLQKALELYIWFMHIGYLLFSLIHAVIWRFPQIYFVLRLHASDNPDFIFPDMCNIGLGPEIK